MLHCDAAAGTEEVRHVYVDQCVLRKASAVYRKKVEFHADIAQQYSAAATDESSSSSALVLDIPASVTRDVR